MTLKKCQYLLQDQIKDFILPNRKPILRDEVYHYISSSGYLQIYANNIQFKLIKILKNIYFVVVALMGENFFTAASKQYILSYPPSSCNSWEFGNQFATFLENFSPAQSLSYLPDMARLAWAKYEVLYEKEVYPSPLEFSKNDFDILQLKFKLNSAIRLLKSSFPVIDIWNLSMNEAQYTSDKIYLEENQTYYLSISRNPQRKAVFDKLTAAEFVFLSALQQNFSLKEACRLALLDEPMFNIEYYIKKHILNNHIIEIYY